MNINKDDELLVIVKHEGRFYWFVAFKEMWVLDRVKWVEDFVIEKMGSYCERVKSSMDLDFEK